MTNTANTSTDSNGARRRPGRQRAGSPSGEALREHIVQAAASVYAEHGYHGSSVALVMQAADVSRPTFYRYFRDRNDVLDCLIGRVNDDLRDRIVGAISEPGEASRILEAVIDAYFAWGQDIGAMAGPLYREIHDPASPASVHRQRILDELLSLITESVPQGEQAVHDPLLYDAAIHLVEHLGHRVFWPRLASPRQRNHRRQIILQALRRLLEVPDG